MANSAPSLESVRERYELEARLHSFKTAIETVEAEMQTFEMLSGLWKELLQEKQSMTDVVSPADEQKLQSLEATLQAELQQFGFTSIAPKSVTISRETFRPSREGFNLGFDLSASDGIRLIWAYVEALLELGTHFQTNHPGFLLLDEPRQQEAAEVSFEQLLRRASTSRERNQQIIFATSEPLSDVQRMTMGIPAQILSFEGRLIRKLR